MPRFRQAILQTDAQHYALWPGRANSFDELYVDFQEAEENGGRRFNLFIHPKQDIVVRKLEVQFDFQIGPTGRFLANGFQSWSETRTFFPDGKIPRLNPLARRRLGFYGDEFIGGIPRGRGYLHSWTYTTVSDAGRFWLFGSLNETTGFTLFAYDQHNAVLTVRKDIEGLNLSHSFPALDFWLGEGVENQLFDAWIALVRNCHPHGFNARVSSPHRLGWTSWYAHFTDISEAKLLGQLAGVASSGLPFEVFQIDDGWQSATGDWLSVKPTFPGGMARMAAAIREKGLVPGLWLAPFVASARSEVARRHPEWLLKDRGGRPLRAGWNPIWGGWYYALDFFHPKVQEYLSGVFHLAREKWGFGWFKLDFLFAASIQPPPGKTRGQVAWEALDFLRRQIDDNTLVACGVPLGAAFGQADLCRIGGDVHLAWEHRLLAWLRHRERVSTLASLRATLARWPLNGRAFGNDPDVFILRKTGQKLNPRQQHTLLTVNALLGSALFTSDDVGAYSPEQKDSVKTALQLVESRVEAVREVMPEVYRIDFVQNGQAGTAWCNLGTSPTVVSQKIDLQPFETIVPE